MHGGLKLAETIRNSINIEIDRTLLGECKYYVATNMLNGDWFREKLPQSEIDSK